MELFVCAILLTVAGAQESQLEGPQNAVIVVGSNVTLKCSSPSRNCNGIDWIKYSHGNPSTVFRDRGGISIAYRGRYSIDNNLPGCGLIIENVQLTDAGRYLCRAIVSSRSVEKTAYLIILENQPKCMTNASDDITAEGDRVYLTCKVTHNKTHRASMVWNGVTGTPAAAKNGKTINQSDSFVVSAPEVPSFTCITSFSVETGNTEIKGLATNSPVTSCGTPAVKILYSVRNVTLSPSLSYFSNVSVITCMAKGRPLPTFKWQEMKSDSTWTDIRSGNEFTVNYVSSKWFRCFAMNIVRDKIYNATSHEFLVNNTISGYAVSDYNETSTDTMTQLLLILMEYKWIVVGAGAGFLLFVILLIICCCVRTCLGYKCCHSGNKSKDTIRDEKTLAKPNQKQNDPPKVKPRSAPTSDLPKRQQVRPPKALPRADNRKVGHENPCPDEGQEETELVYMEMDR